MNPSIRAVAHAVFADAARRASEAVSVESQVRDEIDTASLLVDVDLHCRRCENVGTARFALRTFFAFRDELRAEKLRCECGGVLIDHKPLVLTL